MWGVTESPLIVENKIFITPGGIENNIVALNKNTGEMIWTSGSENTGSSYCSPQFIDGYASPMVVTNIANHIVATDANTGERLWAFPQFHSYNIHPNTPLYSDGYIFSSTGYRVGAMLLRLNDNGRSVEQVWQNNEVDTQMGGAIKLGDYVYASGHRNNFWYCLDWKTGEIRYKVRDISPCNVIYADGMLYCYSERGQMHLVKPNPDRFELVSSFDVVYGTDQHWAHPVIDNGVLYIRHGKALMAYKIK
jgi:outer membrane protein assembly factor BamB